MDLNITKWYVRLFFWSLRIWNKFWSDYSDTYGYEEKTNLCHFVKVIFVLTPLVLMLHAVLYLGAVFVLVVLPMHYFGWGRYFSAMGVLLGCVLSLVLVVLAIRAFDKTKRDQEKTRPPRPYASKERRPREPGILQIISAWLAARKKQICPIINFYEPLEVKKDA